MIIGYAEAELAYDNLLPPEDDLTEPICPNCGKICEKIYMYKDGSIGGCDECMFTIAADECRRCFNYDV
ncbi:MAG: hypothetical protein RR263_02070 [Oscillospiraceae bacterium]